MKGVSILHKMSKLSLIMVKGHPQYLGAPSALVLKEALGRYEWVPGEGLKVVRRIPPRLPLATMKEVYRYLREPADYANLKPNEIPSEDEMAPFERVLSKDQLGAMRDLLVAARLGPIEGAVEEDREDGGS